MGHLFRSLFIGFMLLAAISSLSAASLSAGNILTKADSAVNAPADMYARATMILSDANANENRREMELYQKGDKKRLVRFLSPADQRGVGFLSLPNDVKYLHLPAFRKTRRIASHIENQSFAGTDFSYDDLSAFNYSEEYEPELVEMTVKYYILRLSPKPGNEKEYQKLKVWVRTDNYYPEKIEMYDQSGELRKILEQHKLIQKNGYWIASMIRMVNVQEQHSTILNLSDIELNTGLSDDIFTRRFLMRVR